MDKNKDEVSTRLRLPLELHHKLGVLAELDNKRSLHNYMIKVLQEHVATAERELFEAYEEEFDSVYYSLFGDKYDSYQFVNINRIIPKSSSNLSSFQRNNMFSQSKSRIGRKNDIKQEILDKYNE